jgi:hypothetical protein
MFGVFELISSLFTLLFWGVIITFGVYVVMKINRAKNQITEDQISARWDRLVPGKAEKKEEFFTKVKEEIKKKEVRYPVLDGNVSSGTFGVPEKYVVVDNENCSCYIGAVKEGTDLHVNWALRRKLPHFLYLTPWIGPMFYSLIHGSDFNKINKKNAFADVILDCAGQAAFDISDGTIERKAERKPSGKLGPI